MIRIERNLFGIRLFMLDTGYYKDFISNRINRPTEQPGAWLVYEGCDEAYTAQVTAEHKVKKSREQRSKFGRKNDKR
ncbi:terminase gpA endonuclease subunit [Paenibacillus melissococcoides]|uniref:terminase gpA endonuclease subunit n=1 Tax=Paenibacillus melissococcoides TaxID=2912268 RepID=UPI0021C2CA19|nr:terminase gpA endonuclease subunit [Paenibacillus melissococcoides]